MRCQWQNCEGNLVPVYDENTGQQIGWKCLMCSRSTDMDHEKEVARVQAGKHVNWYNTFSHHRRREVSRTNPS